MERGCIEEDENETYRQRPDLPLHPLYSPNSARLPVYTLPLENLRREVVCLSGASTPKGLPLLFAGTWLPILRRRILLLV